MAYLEIVNARKTYDSFAALDGVSLAVQQHEFFTLLGPSGCGKTTLLRSVAGFNALTEGTIALGGQRIDTVAPHLRDIGMVFQDYAVFPHLTVAENVAFGLKARKVPKAEIGQRVREALDAVRLGKLADRHPAAMSGGQQQRIGLARAMVIRPKLLLMDEPLSNLDAKLRIELREEIRDIQKRLGIATIYVTHDQEEALAVSDRICVMNAGRVEQIGTPYDIYRDPQTRFVAHFVGTINAFSLEAPAARAVAGDLAIDLEHAGRPAAEWAIRPENLVIANGADAAGATLSGTVAKVTYLGREAHVAVDTAIGPITLLVSNPPAGLFEMAGQPLTLSVAPEAVLAFDAAGARVATGR